MSENIKPAYYINSDSLIYNAAMSLNETKQEELQIKNEYTAGGYGNALAPVSFLLH